MYVVLLLSLRSGIFQFLFLSTATQYSIATSQKFFCVQSFARFELPLVRNGSTFEVEAHQQLPGSLKAFLSLSKRSSLLLKIPHQAVRDSAISKIKFLEMNMAMGDSHSFDFWWLTAFQVTWRDYLSTL